MVDAFEKLAGLVGASVEKAPGEGPPRTRAEALALGVKRYFTGLPCKRGHVASRQVSSSDCYECSRLREASPERKERRRQYEAKPEAKERKRRYRAKPEAKERRRQYDTSPEGRECKRRYNASPEAKEYKRQHALNATGDSTLFAISQAMLYATHGIAYSDIVPQCPEPHRSQLQALVDRIKADPQAGKSVVGLLRTMRELRKAELAQEREAEA